MKKVLVFAFAAALMCACAMKDEPGMGKGGDTSTPAAGYYSYLLTEVLAVNIADVFAKRGALDPATGSDFCKKVLSRGNTGDLMQMFSDFTGMAQPDASSLLKARGLGQ